MNNIETWKKEIVSIDKKREELFKIKEPIDKQLSSLYEKKEKLQNQIDTSRINRKGKIDWEWILHCDHSQSTAHYRAAKDAMAKLGLMNSGFYENTNQISISIVINKNEYKKIPKIMKSIDILLPFLKPVVDGFICFGIFEHTLSKHGIFQLKINKKLKGYISCTRYGHEEVTIGSKTDLSPLEDLLKYCAKELWYEDETGEDNV
jgi:hypothetical protein